MNASCIKPQRRPSLPVRTKDQQGKLPIAQDANHDLPDDDAANLEVLHGLSPRLVASLVRLPARGKGCCKERLDVSN